MAQNSWPLQTLYFYLTEGCNLACRHCWLAPKLQNEKHQYAHLSVELFQKILSEAEPLGLQSVKLTGGEPLMHPQAAQLIDNVRDLGLRLVVESNGVLCTPQLAEKMAACKSPSVSVSLDGSSAKTHEWVRGVAGCFDQAITGIRNCVAAGLKPQIIFSVLSANKDQLADVVQLAETLGCGSVKINLIQPTERGQRLCEFEQTLTIAEYIELGKWISQTLAPQFGIPIYYDQPLAFRPLHEIYHSTGAGAGRCGILGILGVLADGSYALCGIGMSIPELVFGHAEKDKLSEVWHDTAVLNHLRTNLPRQLHGVCADCLMKDMCFGSCVAQNYYRTRDLLSGFWYCEWAQQQGLFPAGRQIRSV